MNIPSFLSRSQKSCKFLQLSHMSHLSLLFRFSPSKTLNLNIYVNLILLNSKNLRENKTTFHIGFIHIDVFLLLFTMSVCAKVRGKQRVLLFSLPTNYFSSSPFTNVGGESSLYFKIWILPSDIEVKIFSNS